MEEKHTKSCSRDSARENFPQRKPLEEKELLAATISDHLVLKNQFAPSSPFNIADLGCNTGPHTFKTMKIITEAVIDKHISLPIPEFNVFFNDIASNDFNSLFNNLPADRLYFASAVPGSFHHRLFPRASIDFAYCSNSVHWLSKAPEELPESDSPAYNGDRIFYINSPAAVCDAFFAQFALDMESILNARAQEMIPGGLMVIVVPGRASGTDRAQYTSFSKFFLPLEPILLDLAKEGKVSKGKMDSFNVALYFPSPEELNRIVQSHGSFEVVEMVSLQRNILNVLSADQMRAAFGGTLGKHFGTEIAEEAMDRYEKDVPRLSGLSNTKEDNAVLLYSVIRHKKSE